MSASELLKNIRLVRRDLGNLLFHFTRKNSINNKGSLENLKSIMNSCTIKGSSNYIKGSYNCACFTDAPITELAALFSLVSSVDCSQRARYEPYGIAVKKDWLYSIGGRPVIYQSDEEYHKLSDEIKYRHVRYEPHNDIDFTWEREWRIKTDLLQLSLDHALVVVPTSTEAYNLMNEHVEMEPDFDDEGNTYSVHYPTWMCVSLDLFGLQK